MRTVNEGFPIAEFNGITVNKSLLSSGSNYYSRSSRAVKYIVMHYTGNSSDNARANANYFNTGSRGASAHFFVDDNSCYQSVALNNAAWAVGGCAVYKHGDCRNLNSVSIEMCCSGNYAVSEQTEKNAAYLCAKLCKLIGISANQVDAYVLRHWDVWAKDCPRGWTGSNNARWNGFKARVKALLKGETEDIDMATAKDLQKQIDEMKKSIMEKDNKIKTLEDRVHALEDRVHTLETPMVYNYIDENMPEWARESVQWFADKGIIEGTGEGLGLNDVQVWLCVVIRRVVKKLENMLKIKL